MTFDQTYTMRSRFFQLLGAAGKLLADAYAEADRENQKSMKTLAFEAMTHSLVEHHGYDRSEIISDVPPATAVIEIAINWDHVANALVSVVEGGYSPWFGRLDEDKTDETSVRLRAELIAAGKIWWSEGVYYDQGGKLVLQYDDPEAEEGTFTARSIVGQDEFKAGFAFMATKAPRHFGDMIAENGDAITDDVFVQMVLLGEIVYG